MKSESEVAQLCLTLSDPMDCSPPSSSVHGIFQARVLEWGAITFSRGSSQSYWGLSSELTSPWEMWRVKSELLEGRKWLLLSRSWMPVHHVRIHYSFLIPKKITDFCIFSELWTMCLVAMEIAYLRQNRPPGLINTRFHTKMSH